jgi:uncharacterized membrane protein
MVMIKRTIIMMIILVIMIMMMRDLWLVRDPSLQSTPERRDQGRDEIREERRTKKESGGATISKINNKKVKQKKQTNKGGLP